VIGKTLGELDLRKRTGATVMAVIRGTNTHVSPGAKYLLRENDTVLLSGSAREIEAASILLTENGADSASVSFIENN